MPRIRKLFLSSLSLMKISLIAERVGRFIPFVDPENWIFRILQEALNNVAKHSRADLIQLSLGVQDFSIIMRVHDNGVGFDVTKTIAMIPSRRGVGLASMRERAELSGADFDITSNAGQGTTIWVKWDV